jgi:hypothetical protein
MTSETPAQSTETTQDEYFLTYEQLARDTNISEGTLRRETDLSYWNDEIDMSSNPTKVQLSSYAGCALAELRATTQTGKGLLQSYVEIFEGWTENNFKDLNRAIRRELVGMLEEKRITPMTTEGIVQATMLYEIAQKRCLIHSLSSRTTRSLSIRTPYRASISTPANLLPLQQPDPATQSSSQPPYDIQKEEPIKTTQERQRTESVRLPSLTPAPEYIQQESTAQTHPRPRNNPYELPPQREYANEPLQPEKLALFHKTWKKSNNYSGKPYDILADKTRIFIDTCRRLGIYETQYADVFPDILEDRASMHYMHVIGPGGTWKSLYDKLDQHFNTNVNHSQYWTDWCTMSFARCRREYPDKNPHEVLEKMIDKLMLAQRALGPGYQGEIPLHTTVVRACKGQPELEQALFSVKPTCEGLFSDLRSALQVHLDRQSTQYAQTSHEAFYTDRRYHTASRPQDRYVPRDKYPGRTRGSRSPYRDRTPRRRAGWSGQSRLRDKKCFICHKVGCWSINHPRTDLSRAKRQYVSSYEEFHDETPPHEDVIAYILEYEGQPDSEEEQEESDDQEDPTAEEEDAVHYLTSAAYLHRTTGEDIYTTELDIAVEQFVLDDRYSAKYQGELWDTGAARFSTVGKAQLEAYIRENPRTKVEWTPGAANVSFGGQGTKGSIGTVRIHNPIGTVTYHILDAPTPFLFSIADADRLGAYFNNVSDTIVRHDKSTLPVVRKWGHPFFNVSREEAATFFTETELRRLHRRFGHPRTERLYKMLNNAGHEVTLSVLEEIQKFCHYCQKNDPAPRRFKFTIQDETNFNYNIVLDVVRLGNRNVLHVIDTDTSFQAATFLKSMSARDTWDALCRCWINTYQGPPDYITHDPGTNFASEDFRNRAKIVGAQCREMPVEAHWAVGKIERAHAPLRRTYEILKAELGHSTEDEDILQMATKALNDTAGPNGLVPTLLVFGAYPRINDTSPPSPDIIARAKAIQKATKMLRAERDRANVNRATNTRNGPRSHEILQLPLGTEVLAWREKTGWTGPYEIKSIEGQDVVLHLENKPIRLRCTQVKQYFRKENVRQDPTPQGQEEDTNAPYEDDEPIPPRIELDRPRRRGRPRKKKASHDEEKEQPQYDDDKGQEEEHHASSPRKEIVQPVRRRGRPRKNPVQYETATAFLTQKEKDDYDIAVRYRREGIITTPGRPFEQSDRTEMDSLIANGTFQIQRYDPHKHKGRIFKLRLVREVKGKTATPYEKSRLVFAGHSDTEKDTILTQSPTIQRMSQRLLLAYGVSLAKTYGMHFELRDITQAYVQSTDKLLRTLYAWPPKELQHNFPPDTVFQIVRPLYGAAESGLYWFKTYHAHHREKLHMQTSSYDPCLLLTYDGTDTFGMTGLQTDDTLSIVSAAFAQKEKAKLQEAGFRAKPKTILTSTQPLQFNGGKIHLIRDNIALTQNGQAEGLRTIKEDAHDAQQQYVAQRARGAYIASICQPEAAFDLSIAAQTTNPTKGDIAALNVRIQWQIGNADRGLSYIPLDLCRTKLFIFTDGSFANNKDLSSQLGFIIVPATEHRIGNAQDFEINGNIVHWNSIKCKRVTRSVLASELYGMVGGFDSAIALSTTLQQIARTLQLPKTPLVICTDSKSLYDCLVKLGTTNEKRLMIDIMSLRESYENREISEIRWINGKDNPADACTKKSPNTALQTLISTNQLRIAVEASVDRLNTVRKEPQGPKDAEHPVRQ